MSHVLSGLDAEWRRIASGLAAQRAVRRWGAAHPALRGTTDLNEVLERRRDPCQGRQVLTALAALSRSDELAARTLLQALLPGIVRLANTAGYDHWGASDEMVALAWERIRTYPTDRPGSVSGNVLLDVKKRYRRHRRIDAPRSTALPPSPVLPPRDTDRIRSAEDEAIDRVSFAAFLATQQRVIGQRNLRLVVRTHVDGIPLAEVAAEENVSVHALNVRRRRTEQQLAQQQVSRLQRAG